jgi:hypothetical protein
MSTITCDTNPLQAQHGPALPSIRTQRNGNSSYSNQPHLGFYHSCKRHTTLPQMSNPLPPPCPMWYSIPLSFSVEDNCHYIQSFLNPVYQLTMGLTRYNMGWLWHKSDILQDKGVAGQEFFTCPQNFVSATGRTPLLPNAVCFSHVLCSL